MNGTQSNMNKTRYNFFRDGLDAGFSHEQLQFLWKLHNPGVEKAVSLEGFLGIPHDNEEKPAVTDINGLDYIFSYHKKEVLDNFTNLILDANKLGIKIDQVLLSNRYKRAVLPPGSKILGVNVR